MGVWQERVDDMVRLIESEGVGAHLDPVLEQRLRDRIHFLVEGANRATLSARTKRSPRLAPQCCARR